MARDGTLISQPAGVFRAERRVLYPGFRQNAAPERIELQPGAALWQRLGAGDIVNIAFADPEDTLCLAGLDAANRPSLAILGLDGLKRQSVPAARFDTREIGPRLAARGLSLDDLDLATIAPGPERRFTFKAASDGVLIAAVPARAEALVGASHGGDVGIDVQRAGAAGPGLPDPLGEVRDEFRIHRGTARAYTVREGEYIQVIDVEGQQCSDFMAMNTRQLERGFERHIDSTVTRTMMGGAYPRPGLFDKFFDQNMQPLLAVVQDTVGRHDTFALACTARGYADRGFPGHLNCSDNISEAYSAYGIGRREAWPAINFFFNSWIQPSDNHLRSDESWSRPGDYVAMRALTDLTCVSTACPDDIDPINGWNPTDIHVRIYHPQSPVRTAVAYRPSTEAQAVLTMDSPFHPRTSRLTQRFQPVRDYWVPQIYDGLGANEEYWACREAATIQDMSPLRKLDVTGPDAERLLNHALTRDVRRLSVNRGVYALICDARGAVIDDGTLFRLAPDVFRWCCGSDESAQHLKALAEAREWRVYIRDVSRSLCNLAVQGPSSGEVLGSILFVRSNQPGFDNLKWFGCTIGRLHDRNGPPVMVSRTGFTGELGYEVFCDRADALSVWDALMAAGQPHGLAPMGGQALDMIRIEAGLMVGGAEFSGEVDPDEAGLGFAVDMKKDCFVGKDAIARNRAAPRRKLVGLVFDGDEVPAHGDGVFVGRRQVGTITSATRSPLLGRVIAMARVAVEEAEPGTTPEVGRLDGHMKRLSCETTTIPFVDPRRERARAAPRVTAPGQ